MKFFESFIPGDESPLKRYFCFIKTIWIKKKGLYTLNRTEGNDPINSMPFNGCKTASFRIKSSRRIGGPGLKNKTPDVIAFLQAGHFIFLPQTIDSGDTPARI